MHFVSIYENRRMKPVEVVQRGFALVIHIACIIL
jgi:hypothetical protein